MIASKLKDSGFNSSDDLPLQVFFRYSGFLLYNKTCTFFSLEALNCTYMSPVLQWTGDCPGYISWGRHQHPSIIAYGG